MAGFPSPPPLGHSGTFSRLNVNGHRNGKVTPLAKWADYWTPKSTIRVKRI